MNFLSVEIQTGIATVTFDGGPGNLFRYETYEQFKRVFDDLGRDPAAAVIVLQAAGRDFSLGQDMAELEAIRPDTIDEHYRRVGEGLSAVYLCPKPTIAAVQGMAVGAGVAAAAACDMLIAADDAHFMTPEIQAGIVGCAEFMQLLLPKGLARYYAYSGKPVPAHVVFQHGGALSLSPRRQLRQDAQALARQLLQTVPPEELSFYKRYLNDIDANDLAGKFQMGKRYGKQFLRSPNDRELYNAFWEKRPPRFQPWTPEAEE